MQNAENKTQRKKFYRSAVSDIEEPDKAKSVYPQKEEIEGFWPNIWAKRETQQRNSMDDEA